MKNFGLAFLFFFLLILSCDSSSEDPSDENPSQTTDDDITIDETPPVITVSELPEVLEVATELNISVSDESEIVTTMLLLDGTEIFETTQKSFMFEINPFDFDIGDKSLEVKATDVEGNTASKTGLFELKKLLFRYPSTKWNHNTNILDNYIAVNEFDGTLIEYRKIENLDEPVEFFANDEFEGEEIVVTQYNFSNGANSFNMNFIFSYPEIKVGTIFPTDEERANLQQLQYRPPTANQSKSIFVEGSFISRMWGYGGSIFKFGDPDRYEYIFNYFDQVQDSHLIYDFTNNGDEMTDYKYLLVDDVNQNNYDILDFVQPTDFFEINMPEGLSYELKINGYKDENGYNEYKFHEVFSQIYGESNTTPTQDIVNIPLIGEYSFYQKDLVLQVDTDVRIATVQKGLKPFEIPNLDAQINGNNVTIQGEFDVYNFGMTNSSSWGADPQNTPLFTWLYYGKKGGSVAIPFSSFQIPEELQNKLEENNVTLDPNSSAIDDYFFSITNYEQESFLYEATLFNYGSIRNEYGDRFSLTKNLK